MIDAMGCDPNIDISQVAIYEDERKSLKITTSANSPSILDHFPKFSHTRSQYFTNYFKGK
jgi:hypothetical protein